MLLCSDDSQTTELSRNRLILNSRRSKSTVAILQQSRNNKKTVMHRSFDGVRGHASKKVGIRCFYMSTDMCWQSKYNSPDNSSVKASHASCQIHIWYESAVERRRKVPPVVRGSHFVALFPPSSPFRSPSFSFLCMLLLFQNGCRNPARFQEHG